MSVKQAALAAFLVLLVVSLPFGGMRSAAEPALTVLKKDRTITATPFRITYKGAWQTDDIGDLADTPKLDDGSHYLIVAALVRTSAETSVPSATLREAVRVVGVPGLTRGGTLDPRPVTDSRLADPEVILVDADFHAMGDLPPGLTYGLYWVWRQEPGNTVPQRVTVAVQGTTYRRSSLDRTFGYFDPTEIARGRFPVATWRTLRTSPVAVDSDDGSDG